MNLTIAVGRGHFEFDASTDRQPIRHGAPQPQRDPGVAMPRVQEEEVLTQIALIRTAKDDVQILISVVIDVAERYPVTLLDMPESTCGRHVLKARATDVAEDAIRDDEVQAGFARADVEIQESVVVQVTEVTPHRIQNRAEAAALVTLANVPSL